MDALIGNIEAKTDVKGRAFVPAPFRKILQSAGESRLILRKDDYKDCLVLYPEKVWKEELVELRTRLNKWDEEEQELFREISYVEELEIDASGRILIPKKYLQMANISNCICFLGMFTSIELWNPDLLAKSRMSAEEKKSKLKKLLGSKHLNEKIA